MSWGELIIIGLVLAVIFQRQVKLSTLKRIEGTMATQQDVETLNAKLDAVQTAAETCGADVTALKEELRVANENSSVDLSGAISKAEGIEARLLAIAGPNAGSDPEVTEG